MCKHLRSWVDEKILPNLISNGGGNHIYQLVKNLLNLMKKRGEKPEELIDEKPPKLGKKTMIKTDHLLFCRR